MKAGSSPLVGLSLAQAKSPSDLPVTSERFRPNIVLNNVAHPVLMRLLASVEPKQLGPYISMLAELGARGLYFPAETEQVAVVDAKPPAPTYRESRIVEEPAAPNKAIESVAKAVPMDDLSDDVIMGFVNMRNLPSQKAC
jgi:hypothetical protein